MSLSVTIDTIDHVERMNTILVIVGAIVVVAMQRGMSHILLMVMKMIVTRRILVIVVVVELVLVGYRFGCAQSGIAGALAN